MRRHLPLVLTFCFTLLFSTAAIAAEAGQRVPDEHWLRYADPAEAGFDPAKLEAARQTWEGLPSSAFLVVADGAVVASWGEAERRFMCHSVRKSFLSALYGIYWDQGKIDLNKTMADLGIDDEPDPLLPIEKQARILDLLKARSGVFHPAAYAGRTDSRPRGSEGPGRYFAYNNWDFNTLATILMQETGEDVFEAFDQYFGQPLGMEDWRVSDGYYHYERDKSKYPAYPFRMSARDAARFGLLFAREGMWGEERILSHHWVRRSAALYSIDSDIMGYGFMWWVFLQPRFAEHGMFSALGVGNQMIAALPDSDLVIVNRANTYDGEGTPTGALLDLIEQVLKARTGEPATNPRLVPLEADPPDPKVTRVPAEKLAEFVGEWPFPPPPLGLPERTRVKVTAGDGHLEAYVPFAGTFELYLQPDGSLYQEDARERLLVIRDEAGALAGVATADVVVQAALTAAGEGKMEQAEAWLARVEGDESASVEMGRIGVHLVSGRTEEAERRARALIETVGPREVEGRINGAGYGFLQGGDAETARAVFELNTRLFPDSANVWDSLGEAHMNLGNDEEAIRFYRKSLELNPENSNATAMIERIQGGGEGKT